MIWILLFCLKRFYFFYLFIKSLNVFSFRDGWAVAGCPIYLTFQKHTNGIGGTWGLTFSLVNSMLWMLHVLLLILHLGCVSNLPATLREGPVLSGSPPGAQQHSAGSGGISKLSWSAMLMCRFISPVQTIIFSCLPHWSLSSGYWFSPTVSLGDGSLCGISGHREVCQA